MHKRTKACAISKKTKQRVYERDMGACIFCGAPGLPEAHMIPRSHGGLGVEQNIVTACRICHDKLDNSVERQQMLQEAAEHLERFYPGWNPKNYIFDKWHKDKAQSNFRDLENNKQGNPKASSEGKQQKDKGEPPDGFYFLGGDDDRV